MGVEFLLEVCKHVSGGSVDVGNRLCGDEDPEWSRRGLYKATDLVAEGAGVSEEQGRVESEDHESW